jgi:hypothetical protein
MLCLEVISIIKSKLVIVKMHQKIILHLISRYSYQPNQTKTYSIPGYSLGVYNFGVTDVTIFGLTDEAISGRHDTQHNDSQHNNK